MSPAAMLRLVLVEAAALHVRAAADFRSQPDAAAPQWAEAHDRVAELLTRELSAVPRTAVHIYLDAANQAQLDGRPELAALLMRTMRAHGEVAPRTRGDAVDADDIEPAVGDVVRADSDRSPASASSFPVRS
jgi:hypothetical protein